MGRIIVFFLSIAMSAIKYAFYALVLSGIFSLLQWIGSLMHLCPNVTWYKFFMGALGLFIVFMLFHLAKMVWSWMTYNKVGKLMNADANDDEQEDDGEEWKPDSVCERVYTAINDIYDRLNGDGLLVDGIGKERYLLEFMSYCLAYIVREGYITMEQASDVNIALCRRVKKKSIVFGSADYVACGIVEYLALMDRGRAGYMALYYNLTHPSKNRVMSERVPEEACNESKMEQALDECDLAISGTLGTSIKYIPLGA